MSRLLAAILRWVLRLYALSQRRWVRVGSGCIVVWWALSLLVTVLTEAQWFDALGYGEVWRRRVALQWLLFGLTAGGTLVFAALPLRAATTSPQVRLRLPARYEFLEQGLHSFHRHGARIAWGLTAALALLMARGVAIHWNEWLLFQHGGTFGVRDPYFGRDAGFYVFRLPGWHLLLDTAWTITSFTLVVTGALALGHGLSHLLSRAPALPYAPLRWVLGLAALWFALRAAGYYLAHFDLATAQHPDAIITAGISYVDWHVRRPLLWLGVVLSCMMAVGLLLLAVGFQSSQGQAARPGVLLLLVLAAWLVPELLARAVPGLVTRLLISPDEPRRERAFIHSHLQATQTAWQLAPEQLVPWSPGAAGDSAAPHLDANSIRVWDAPRLAEVARANEPVPPHYQLGEMHLDRYPVAGCTRLVGVAACEINHELVARRGEWVNRHVEEQYTHGTGVVVYDATQAGSDGAPVTWRRLREEPISNIQQGMPKADGKVTPQPPFALREPRVFYGASEQEYALVEDSTVGGLAVDSVWRRALWAWRLGDANLLLHRGSLAPLPVAAAAPRRVAPAEITPRRSGAGALARSGAEFLLFRRAMRERAAALAPFLTPGGQPYPVIQDGHLIWLMDMLTTTSSYPAAAALAIQAAPCNAARDSVKMVMDAVDGRVTFYVAAESAVSDPILRAWQRAFPGLVRPYAEMAPGLRRHRRYPPALFEAQLRLLGRYHAQSPESFYRGNTEWAVWQPPGEEDGRPPEATPGYALLPARGAASHAARPDAQPLDAQRFVLQAPLTVAGRLDLVALLQAGCDGDEYGQLQLLRMGSDQQPGNQNGPASGGLQKLDAYYRSIAPLVRNAGRQHPRGQVLAMTAPGWPGRTETRPALLLFQPIYTLTGGEATDGPTSMGRQSQSGIKLWRVAVTDAATPDAPVGSGKNPQLALEDLRRRMQGSAVTNLAAEALRLHQEAQQAAAQGSEGWQRAGELWARERAILEKLAGMSKP